MKYISIAIDGPSGAGKSSISQALARRLGFTYVDTGAIYRTVGLVADINGADPKNYAEVEPYLKKAEIEIRHIEGEQRIFLNGEDVSGRIRTEKASKYASDISALPEIRAFLLETQRDFARKGNVIMDGRDIGTVVLPDADVKIYLTASAEVRAERRLKQLMEKGEPAEYEAVLEAIRQRDHNDSTRKTAPLKKADDATEVDSSYMTFDEVVERIYDIVKKAAK